MCAVYTLRPVPLRGAHHSIVAQQNVSRNTLSTGNGVVVSHPLSMREALGSIPSVNHLAALSVQGTTCNMQCAMPSVQSAVRGVQFSSLQCVRCIHSALSPFEGLITVLSRKTKSAGTPCIGHMV